jgi:glutathione S-transferase
MKVYYHPASTTSRPIMLFAAEEGLDIDFQIVDLFSGEHYQEPYSAINPNHLVPVLDDGDFRLTESSAILKYLAEKTGSAAYPSDIRARARVNERMDWINTQLARDFAYGFVYPQLFPMHKRPSADVQAATLAWGGERAKGWLAVLDRSILGGGNRYLCGAQLTIADYFAAPFVALGEAVRCDYSGYPNVGRWLATMKQLKSWPSVSATFDGFAATMKDAQFATL